MRTMRHAPAMHLPCVCHASCQQALKSIDTVKILSCGMAAVATYTSHEKFTYKGSPVRALRSKECIILSASSCALERNMRLRRAASLHRPRGCGLESVRGAAGVTRRSAGRGQPAHMPGRVTSSYAGCADLEWRVGRSSPPPTAAGSAAQRVPS